MSDVTLLQREMYAESEAARLLGVAQGTLHHWLDGGTRRGKGDKPALRIAPTNSRSVTWAEFVEAGLLRQYRRDLNVPMAELRAFIDKLRDRYGVPYPLASDTLGARRRRRGCRRDRRGVRIDGPGGALGAELRELIPSGVSPAARSATTLQDGLVFPRTNGWWIRRGLRGGSAGAFMVDLPGTEAGRVSISLRRGRWAATAAR